MSTALDIARQLAPKVIVKTVEIKGEDGTVHEFQIKRFIGVGEKAEVERRITERLANLKTLHKGKTPIIVTAEDVVGFEALLPDLEPIKGDKEGKLQFFLTNESDIKIATTLEQSVVSPEMPWRAAALYSRCLADVCMDLVIAVGEMNTTEALADAKND